MFSLQVDEEISLRLHDAYNIDGFLNLIKRNRVHLRQHMNWEKNHQSVDDSFDFVLQARENFAERKNIPSQIYYKGEIAGSVGLTLHNLTSGYAEVGYWLGEEFTGKGIATRATKAILNFGFNTLKLHKIVLRVITGNDKSIAIAKRLNFTFEGVQIQQRLLRGKHYDYQVYYMLRDDWQDNTAPHFEYRLDEHTTLRPLMMHDAKPLFNLLDTHRETLREWLDWVDSQQKLRDTKHFIAESLGRYGHYNGLDCGIWQDDQICGLVSFNSWSLRNYKAEIGYWLAKPYTGKGIMTKAVKAMVTYGFEVVGLHRIELLCAVDNKRSCAVAERLNFTHEGVLRRGERIREQFHDVNVYAILQPNWQA